MNILRAGAVDGGVLRDVPTIKIIGIGQVLGLLGVMPWRRGEARLLRDNDLLVLLGPRRLPCEGADDRAFVAHCLVLAFLQLITLLRNDIIVSALLLNSGDRWHFLNPLFLGQLSVSVASLVGVYQICGRRNCSRWCSLTPLSVRLSVLDDLAFAHAILVRCSAEFCLDLLIASDLLRSTMIVGLEWLALPAIAEDLWEHQPVLLKSLEILRRVRVPAHGEVVRGMPSTRPSLLCFCLIVLFRLLVDLGVLPTARARQRVLADLQLVEQFLVCVQGRRRFLLYRHVPEVKSGPSLLLWSRCLAVRAIYG